MHPLQEKSKQLREKLVIYGDKPDPARKLCGILSERRTCRQVYRTESGSFLKTR